MPILSKEDKNFLFIHIPKTGGTTIERTFMKSEYQLAYRTTAGTPENKITICTPQHFHAEILKQIFVLNKLDGIFSVVRNPYDRCKSEYAMRNKNPDNNKADKVAAWLNRKMEQYKKNPFVNDNHIRPQNEYLVEGTEIFKLEEGMENIFEKLARKFGMSVEYKKSFKVMTSNNVSGYSSSDVELNSESIQIINDFYHEDFATFDYDKRY